MTTKFTVAANMNSRMLMQNVSKGDAETFEIDFAPWQEDNATILSVAWAVESGSVAISSQALTAGVASALLTFSSSGRSLISITASTATQSKKVWLEVNAKDIAAPRGDYCDGL